MTIIFYSVFTFLISLLFALFFYSTLVCVFGKWVDAEYHHTERRKVQNKIFYKIEDEVVMGLFPAERGKVGKALYDEGKKYRVIYNKRANVVMDKTMLITDLAGLIFFASLLVVLVIMWWI